MALSDIETIVFCMLENRSFDHMLGYLSLKPRPGKPAVEGLSADPGWVKSYRNMADGKPYDIKWLPPAQVVDDPPHALSSIQTQIDTPPAGPGPTRMGGFAQTYADSRKGVPKKPPLNDVGAVMGYYDAKAVPTFDFFAANYCICDHWFSALPLGTQPNRLMAMAGETSLVQNTSGFPIPDQRLVYDWLHDHKIRWCAYQSGNFLPFFTLMARFIPEIALSLTASEFGIKTHFRRYARFRKDWTKAAQVPQVIFIEPEYGDGPHAAPNDDHPPTGVAGGQALLQDLYQVLISNPARWQKTLLVITYDEHGGFFDHVPPFPLDTTVAGFHFPTTGVRVPAILVSPHVGEGKVFSEPLDHTSFLQLLADRFTPGMDYSPAVAGRQAKLSRIAKALLPAARTGPAPTLALPAAVKAAAARPIAAAAAAGPSAPHTPNAVALDAATRQLAHDHPELLDSKGWEGIKAYLESNPPPVVASPDHITTPATP